MGSNKGIFWFRQDLRLNDNLALNDLIKKCDEIIPIFIFDQNVKLGGASQWWLQNSLEALNNSLIKRNSQLYCFKGSPLKILDQLVNEYNISNINWNRLYDGYSIDRDSSIKKKLLQKNILIHSFKGSLINEPWSIKNKSNSFFKVFTPYWNKCLEEIKVIKLHKPPKQIKTFFNQDT